MDLHSDGTVDRRRIQVELRTMLAVLLAVFVALALAALIEAASRPIGWGIACALLAALIAPVIDVVDRLIPHALAVLVVVAALAVSLVGAWVGIATTVVDNVDRIVTQAPDAAAEIEANSSIARDFGLSDRVASFVDEIENRFGLGAQLGQSPSTASTYLVTGILMLFFVVYGRRFYRGAIAQIDDEGRRGRIDDIALRAYWTWSRYVWAAAVQLIVLTAIAWPLLWWLDLPGPFVLALALGVMSVIPYLGIPFGGLGVGLFAAATTDLRTIVAVAVFVVAMSLLEILIVRPRVDAATLYVGPAVPVVVGLIGWQLFGIGGAVYGILAAMLALAVLEAGGIDGEPDPVE